MSLTLDRIWLNDGEDPTGDRIAIGHVGDGWQLQPTLGGGVEGGYGSGRSRVWTTEDDTTVVTLPLAWLTTEHIAWLTAHRGRVLWFRDNRGNKLACAFHGWPISYSSGPLDRAGTIDTGQVTLTSVGKFTEAV